MTLEILLFSSYREQAGQNQVTLELAAGASVRDAATALESTYPELTLKGALAAVNEIYASPDQALQAGDTLAFFPPVAGGSDGGSDHFFVTRDGLDLTHYVGLVTAPAFGAVGSFIGTARSPNLGQEVLYIDYQGYESMILGQMRGAATELRETFDLGRIVFAHRLGKLEPGEASIMLVISSKHRKDALLATHAAIDRLKELLPVWKLEATPEGRGWVEGSSAAAEPL